MNLKRGDIFHAFARSGFGCSYTTANSWVGRSSSQLAEHLLQKTSELQQFDMIKPNDPSLADKKGLSKTELDKLKRDGRLSQIEMNKLWLEKMTADDAGFGEKLTLFWHDHFATVIFFPWLVQKQINTFRSLGIGPLKPLLMAMISDPAMLIFLNNQQNRVGAINENFAREFLELFTIGRGNYTENDIKESARALTGWKTNQYGNSRFDPRLFDRSEKTILGKTGNFGAEDLVDIVLADKRTSVFLASKFFAFYISDKPDEKIIRELADVYYKENYNTGKLLKYIFSSEFFYDPKFRAARIKSPVELLVGLYRMVPVRYEGDDPNVNIQRLMGQVMLFPPSVAGWSWGKSWIDSSTLLFRLELPTKILSLAYVDLAENERAEELNDEAKMLGAKALAKFKPYANWQKISDDLSMVKNEELDLVLSETMLRTSINKDLISVLKNDHASIKSRVLEIMALPEYQLT